MRVGVVVFPGSNCDRDCLHVLKGVLGVEAVPVFHKERRLPALDMVVLPGGFSYGDYLRPGAIARFSPIVDDVVRFCEHGGLVLGICNGFQVLLEASLLPGALMPNAHGRFVCRQVWLRVESNDLPFTMALEKGQVLRMPVAHACGRYHVEEGLLERLRSGRRIAFTYCDRGGDRSCEANPSGSTWNIAGVANWEGNCLGMMPHPERSSEPILGGMDGLYVFRSVLEFFSRNGH